MPRISQRDLKALAAMGIDVGEPKERQPKKASRRKGGRKGKQDRYGLHLTGLPPWVAEHRFHPSRKWRFDFAWPDQKIALEVDGGVWSGGRHTRGAGFIKDQEKRNAATLLGWRVFNVTPADMKSGKAARLIAEAIGLYT